MSDGDLDPNNSPHTLVPLKVAYKKLRLLVDLGCVFVGHGLSKDFRTISTKACLSLLTEDIFVPPDQVMDTVNIYTIPGQRRKLSLRFLTWFLLKKDIQTHTHDSIEDARYALLLYKLYQDFEEEGRFEYVMEDVFFEGSKTVSLTQLIPGVDILTPTFLRVSKLLKIARHPRLCSLHFGQILPPHLAVMPLPDRISSLRISGRKTKPPHSYLRRPGDTGDILHA